MKLSLAALVLASAAAAAPLGNKCAPAPAYPGTPAAPGYADNTPTTTPTGHGYAGNSPSPTPSPSPPDLVQLDYLTARGVVSADGAISTFYAIPYAAPPVGKLRFRPPQPPAAFSGIFNATAMGGSCIQAPGATTGGANYQGSEDCLNLNVFAPADAIANAATKRLPVVVFIFGGGFTEGYSNVPLYNGVNLLKAMPGRIVVVPNYRVNAFGFLVSSELEAEGSLNAGLLDQKAAFEWVRKHISKFGGDPNHVTAWGESAGAISIATHLVGGNPNKPLFDRVVLESGALVPVAAVPASEQQFVDVAFTKLGCKGANATLPVVDCLRALPAQTLLSAFSSLGLQFRPAVDRSYIKEQPHLTLARGGFAKMPAIFVTNTDEGTLFPLQGGVKDTNSALAFERYATRFLNDTMFAQVQELYPMAKYPAPFFAAADLYGDLIFKCPVRQLAMALASAGSPVYVARFNVKPTVLNPQTAAIFSQLGVYHSAELPFVWNFQQSVNQTNGEAAVSKAMMSSWADFFDGGAPGSSVPLTWPQFGESGKRVVWQTANNGVLETIDAVSAASAAAAGVSYLPAVDGKYVKQQPQVALSKGQIYKIPAIILDNNDEGTYFTTSITTPEALDALQNSFSFLGDAGLAAAKQMYSVANFGSPIAAGANFYGDAVFKCPDRQLAKALTAAGAKVYKGRFSIKPTINLAAGDAFFSAIGVYHTAEMAFVWNYSPLLNQTNYEKSISQKMINTWSDFFAGSPFPGLLTAGINWPTYGSTGKRLVWSSTGTSVETEPADFAARCDFWEQADLAFSTVLNG
ncbi:hypothetical protein HK105_204091 [Polyrhizophydium stewartii]|uniref:Carboxylesterase type B domain-containing protein n=1 Tax=Polyrhizophydium stewartii TaxID=2732419 RepID=A0ABR4N9Z0_9FUNG|nr:hypothetical protein HK105_000958 [Polyrhizophydium stewartii]